MAVEGYDLVMIGILAVAALLGYFKGMVWQLAWIAGIVASSFVALRFAAPLAPYFGQQAPWNRYIAMLALYAGTSLVVWLVFRMIAGAINAVHLSAFDHQLGLLLGLAKGALLCVVITFFSVTLAPRTVIRLWPATVGALWLISSFAPTPISPRRFTTPSIRL